MIHLAEVVLWGRTIGAVALDSADRIANFEYERDFARSGIEVAPLTMPLADRVYRFPQLALPSFHGLPGLLADSLPDKFGNALIDAWLALQGRQPGELNAVERLCYTGRRGMGALEFKPVIGPRMEEAGRVEIDQLVALASDILSSRDQFKVALDTQSRKAALTDILRVGTSAGGARAKAVIAWNPDTNEVRSGQIETESGFEYWLLKFDGVSGNRDKELDDPKGYGQTEFAYYKMAVDCGIEMSECRLLRENDRQHFMTRRFDRTVDGSKLHMQSLSAMAHFDFNVPGAYSYEQALLVIRQLQLGVDAVEQQFRRMAFNIIGRNQDDHVKNIAFLMDKRGRWALSPAFDMTYSYNPSGRYTSRHQMSLNGKQDDFTMDDFRACARAASLQRGRADVIVNEVASVIARFADYADDAGVDPDQRDRILPLLRHDLAGGLQAN